MPQQMSSGTGIVEFIIRLMIKLTVQLVVEILKFALLSCIILGALGVFFLIFLFGLRWSYIAYNGDVLVVAGMGALVLLLELGSLWGIQYMVRDVLHLTDMTLWDLAAFVCKGIFRRRTKNCPPQGQTEESQKPDGEKLD